MSTTTAEAIRDRIITVISAHVPASLAGTGYRGYRNEGDADFETWCQANPAQGSGGSRSATRAPTPRRT